MKIDFRQNRTKLRSKAGLIETERSHDEHKEHDEEASST
jgi:hypothetical protein